MLAIHWIFSNAFITLLLNILCTPQKLIFSQWAKIQVKLWTMALRKDKDKEPRNLSIPTEPSHGAISNGCVFNNINTVTPRISKQACPILHNNIFDYIAFSTANKTQLTCKRNSTLVRNYSWNWHWKIQKCLSNEFKVSASTVTNYREFQS